MNNNNTNISNGEFIRLIQQLEQFLQNHGGFQLVYTNENEMKWNWNQRATKETFLTLSRSYEPISTKQDNELLQPVDSFPWSYLRTIENSNKTVNMGSYQNECLQKIGQIVEEELTKENRFLYLCILWKAVFHWEQVFYIDYTSISHVFTLYGVKEKNQEIIETIPTFMIDTLYIVKNNQRNLLPSQRILLLLSDIIHKGREKSGYQSYKNQKNEFLSVMTLIHQELNRMENNLEDTWIQKIMEIHRIGIEFTCAKPSYDLMRMGKIPKTEMWGIDWQAKFKKNQENQQKKQNMNAAIQMYENQQQQQ